MWKQNLFGEKDRLALGQQDVACNSMPRPPHEDLHQDEYVDWFLALDLGGRKSTGRWVFF